jgi:hypothetical protein
MESMRVKPAGTGNLDKLKRILLRGPVSADNRQRQVTHRANQQ